MVLKHFDLLFILPHRKEITPTKKKIEQTKHTIPIDTDTDANTTRDLKRTLSIIKKSFYLQKKT